MAETWPSPTVFQAFIERIPARDRLFRDSLTRLGQYVERNGDDAGTVALRRAMVAARTAYRRLDDELRVDWDAIKERDPALREAEQRYWARQNPYGAQNVAGVGLGPATVFLIIVAIIAIGAVGVLVNESYQRRRPSLIAAYTRAQIDTNNAAELRRVFAETRDPSILTPVAEVQRDPTNTEAIMGGLAPLVVAAGIGLIVFLFAKGR